MKNFWPALLGMLFMSLGLNLIQFHQAGVLREARQSILVDYYRSGALVADCHEKYSELNLVLLRAFERSKDVCRETEYEMNECLNAMAWDKVWIEGVYSVRHN